jgi:hypothetical protein
MVNFKDMMKCDIPIGESGNCKIERFVVTEAEASFDRMRGMFRDGRYVPAGDYTRLLVNGGIMMSDTPDELRDHIYPLRIAHGICLVAGLGLGCIVRGMLEKCKDDGSFAVDKVIVLEIDKNVIDLVGKHIKSRYGDRLEIRHVDALVYKPPKGEKYDICWFDIWPDICTDNLKDMEKLHRRYGRKCEWQGSWQKERLQDIRRREKRQRAYWR